MTQNKNKTK